MAATDVATRHGPPREHPRVFKVNDAVIERLSPRMIVLNETSDIITIYISPFLTLFNTAQ